MDQVSHSVRVRGLDLNFGSVKVLQDLNLDVKEGEFIVLLGASGCGKSTLLNCIAGLLEPTDGQIFIKDKNVTWLEPSQRGIGMVFQSYALYPQMTVRGNLAFGLQNARVPKAQIDERVARAAKILQLEPYLDRKPANLSGGQRQRVAIGRALVRDVDVFLFDEPLSNLDAKLRNDLRVEIKRLHQRLKNTMIYVTHDQIEAMTLADRIAIMKNGIIQQFDTPHNIYNRPVNLFVADFIGSPSMNFITGRVEDGDFVAGVTRIPVKNYAYSNGTAGTSFDGVLGVRPEHIFVGDAAEAQPYKAQAQIEIIEPMGADTLLWTKLADQSLTVRSDTELNLHVGDTVTIGFDPARGSLFDAKSGERV